jgi:hypothetical protein
VAAFCGTFLWIFAIKILENLSFNESDHSTLFSLMVLHSLIIPSAGFFNLYIYLRPRYPANFPKETRMWAVRRALYGESCRSELAPDDGRPSSSAFGKV